MVSHLCDQQNILSMHVPRISHCIHQEAPCCAGTFLPSLLWNPSGKLKLFTLILPWDLFCFPFLRKKGQVLFEIQTNIFLHSGPENFLSVAADVPPVFLRLFKNPSSLVCLKCPTLVNNLVYQSEMLDDWGFYNLWHTSLLSDTSDCIDCTHRACYWPLLKTRYKNNFALAGDCHY